MKEDEGIGVFRGCLFSLPIWIVVFVIIVIFVSWS